MGAQIREIPQKVLSKTHTKKHVPKVMQIRRLRMPSNLKNYAPAYTGA